MSILHFESLGLFLSIFSSSENLNFKLPPHLRFMKIQRKFREIVIFCNTMVCRECFKSENIVVTNGKTHCKLKKVVK